MGIFNGGRKARKENNDISARQPPAAGKTVYPDAGPEDREFDLNIEKILDNCEVYHAVREIIANALDEQTITDTRDISIYKTMDGCWHIADFGRGFDYHYLTQNENEEKLRNDKLIGKFGVGLKDALATFYRHGIDVRISSKYGEITLKMASKEGSEDITTLHTSISAPEHKWMVGTDVCLDGCKDEDIEKARALFLKFSRPNILEETQYGDIIEREPDTAYIYINGVRVAEEPNFLFSYNITSLTQEMRKSLNRERTNVGRKTYSYRIRSILCACESQKVVDRLMRDMREYASGRMHEELGWKEVRMHTAEQIRDQDPKTAFVTAEDLQKSRGLVDEMERSEYTVCVIPDNLVKEMEAHNQAGRGGDKFTTASKFSRDEAADFNPEPVIPRDLSPGEKYVYDQTDRILAAAGGIPRNVRSIEIVEKLYDHGHGMGAGAVGLWQKETGRIFIKRSQLVSLSEYAGTLLHECAHAMSGAGDVNREFELELTDLIGILAAQLIDPPGQPFPAASDPGS